MTSSVIHKIFDSQCKFTFIVDVNVKPSEPGVLVVSKLKRCENKSELYYIHIRGLLTCRCKEHPVSDLYDSFLISEEEAKIYEVINS